MNTNDCRKMIAESMDQAGYSERDVRMFLAGATLVGYLADDRASWAREFLVRKFFTYVDPWDERIDAAGERRINWRLWNEAEELEQKRAQNLAGIKNKAEAERRAARADAKRSEIEKKNSRAYHTAHEGDNQSE